jgi:phosphoglycerol transferase
VGVTALLMGVTAGGGELLAIAGLSQVRAWDRISVFLAFVGIAAAARFLDRLLARHGVTTKSVVAIVAVCTVVAILDQTSPVDVPPYKATAAQFATEQAFVKGIERTVGPHAAILQLPYVAYPEFGFQWRMRDYSHLRGWLYSDTLRWSYGAIKGRPNWQDGQVGLPFPEQLRRARRAGFTAVWIDRRGYRDNGKGIERRVRACLGAPISVERDKHRVLYDLRAAPHC